MDYSSGMGMGAETKRIDTVFQVKFPLSFDRFNVMCWAMGILPHKELLQQWIALKNVRISIEKCLLPIVLKSYRGTYLLEQFKKYSKEKK